MRVLAVVVVMTLLALAVYECVFFTLAMRRLKAWKRDLDAGNLDACDRHLQDFDAWVRKWELHDRLFGLPSAG